ncbi:MAG: hypothetical protein AAF927_14005 [Bacteroidota bacterium]
MKLSRFLLLLFVGFSFLPACNQDPCRDTICGANGECQSGICECNPGYMTDDFGRCEVSIAEQIAGNYHATSTGCNIDDYVLTIQENPAVSGGLFIVNIGKYTCNSTGGELTIRANFTSETQFDIEAEEIYCDQYSIIGTGTFNPADSTIQIFYRAEYEIGGGSQIIENCTVDLAK